VAKPDKFVTMKMDVLKEAEAILFDFEGTLVDRQWNTEAAVQDTLQMLRGIGLPVDRLQGKTYRTLVKEAMAIAAEAGSSPQDVKEKIYAVYDRYDEDALSRWALRPGALELLETLYTKEIKTGLVSNVGTKGLERALLKFCLHLLFEVVVSRNDVQNLKPSGEGLSLAMNRLQVKKERAFLIGDSLEDIRAAREVGLKVVIILGGAPANPDLLAACPDFLIQDFSEVLNYFEEGSGS
jgi:HAD superfamily hydrolase (TIGR01509 family)